jgi:uncharacterized membrane protein YccF (DUF307 family)
MMPDREDAARAAGAAAGSSFWIILVAVWLVLIAIAGTLALALGIWNLLQAF